MENNFYKFLFAYNNVFCQNYDSSFYLNEDNTFPIHEKDFKGISDNLRLLNMKRLREEEFIFESKIEYNNIEKKYYDVFNPEKSDVSEISFNEENNIILNNEYNDIHEPQKINSMETNISKDEFEENNEYNFTIDDSIKEFLKEIEIIQHNKNNNENTSKGKKFFNVKTLINRGRKRINLEGEKNNQKKHKKTDLDNILTKVQVHFITFIVNITNEIKSRVIKQDQFNQFNFLDIDYNLKKKINFKTFENLKTYKVKDILQLPASKKYKSLSNKDDYNKMILKLVYNSSEDLKELFNMNYLSLFEIYYNDCKPLKRIILKGKEFILSDELKCFYNLVEKNNYNDDEKNLFIESTKNAYFCNTNKNCKNSFYVKKGCLLNN